MDPRIPEVVKKANKKLPHFEDGRIDYSNAERPLAVVVFLKHGEEILILKRSEKVDACPQKWGLVSGYLDELEPIIKMGLKEIKEETGIEKDKILSIEKKGRYEWQSKKENKEYTSFLLLAELKEKPEIELSWEHEKYKWVKLKQAEKYLSPNFIEEMKIVLS